MHARLPAHRPGHGPLFITDKDEARLDYARRLGPQWTGNPDRVKVEAEISRLAPMDLDIVYECTGDSEALRRGIRLLKPGGLLVSVGIPADEGRFPCPSMNYGAGRSISSTSASLPAPRQRRSICSRAERSGWPIWPPITFRPAGLLRPSSSLPPVRME